MKKLILLTVILLSLGNAFAQQEQFSKIDIRSAAKVIIDYGGKCSYSIEDSSQTYKMNIFVHNGTLIIDSKIHEYSSVPLVHVTMPQIEAIDIDGAGRAVISGNFNIEQLEGEISGAAIIKIMERPVIKNMEFEISGAGGIKIETLQPVENADIDINGAGFFSADNTCIKKLKIDISGAAVANVCVSDDLKADISGLGVLTYSGKPKKRKITNSGLGIVQIKGD